MKLRVVMTNGVNYLIESGEFKDKDLMSALLKFHSDDWGILCNEDKEFQNELLKNPNISLLDVSLSVGYNNQSYFSTVFKKITSKTPLEFRDEYLKNKK